MNLIRVAYQALAAVLGGCQSLHTNSMDETLALPSEHAVTLALRTQQILAHETGVADVADPLGGSYYVESLTEGIAEAAKRYIQQDDRSSLLITADGIDFMENNLPEQKTLERFEKFPLALRFHFAAQPPKRCFD